MGYVHGCSIIHHCFSPVVGNPHRFPHASYPTTAVQSSENQPDAEVTPRVIPQAETLEYFHLEKRLVAAGQVVIISGETALRRSRRAQYREWCWGRIRASQIAHPRRRCTDARLDFELAHRTRVFYEGSGVVAESYVVSGERIERLGNSQYWCGRAESRPCTAPLPDWEFRAREAHIDLGDYVTLKHPSFWIRGTSVLCAVFHPPDQGEAHQDSCPPG